MRRTIATLCTASALCGVPSALSYEVGKPFRNPENLVEAQNNFCFDRVSLLRPKPQISLQPIDFDNLSQKPDGVVRVQTCVGEIPMKWMVTVMNIDGGNQIIFGNPLHYPRLALQVNAYRKNEANVTLCFVPGGVDQIKSRDISRCGRITSSDMIGGILEKRTEKNIVGEVRGGRSALGHYERVITSNPRSKELVIASKKACARVVWGQNMVRLTDFDGQLARRCRAKA